MHLKLYLNDFIIIILLCFFLGLLGFYLIISLFFVAHLRLLEYDETCTFGQKIYFWEMDSAEKSFS